MIHDRKETSMPANEPNHVFVCYSHQDAKWLERLRTMLQPVLHSENILFWSDTEIQPGDLWREQINEALATAKVAVLMVSPNFLSSPFITKVELPAILAAAKLEKRTAVLWVPVSTSIFEGTEIARYQAVIDPKSPLDELTRAKRNRALKAISTAIADCLRSRCELEGNNSTSRSYSRSDARNIASRPNTSRVEGGPPAQITYRHESEVKGGDELLHTASEAHFIALTYKTLGLALTSGDLRLPQMRSVELGVYALPILCQWHPTLRNSGERLEQEWTEGLNRVLAGLLERERCPSLSRVDVRIINRVPTFTASILTNRPEAVAPNIRIRYTPVLEDEEPSSTPTINLTVQVNRQSETDPIFSAYTRIVDNMRTRGNPLTYPVLRNTPQFRRPDLDAFVRRLALISNHPRYDLPDAEFRIRIDIERGLARQIGIFERSISDDRELSPDLVYAAFDALRESGRVDEFRVSIDFVHNEAFIEAGRPSATSCFRAIVRGRHKIGVFALLTRGSGFGRAVVLKHKGKRPWPFDVPGGKVADVDRSIGDTVTRELFEELGILIERTQLAESIAVKYDKHSQKEGVPVIAVYCSHELTASEATYLEEFLPPDGEAADRHPLVFHNVEELLRKKHRHRRHRRKDLEDAEAECHAPLEAIVQIATPLR